MELQKKSHIKVIMNVKSLMELLKGIYYKHNCDVRSEILTSHKFVIKCVMEMELDYRINTMQC